MDGMRGAGARGMWEGWRCDEMDERGGEWSEMGVAAVEVEVVLGDIMGMGLAEIGWGV